ncbi:hypothetical protein HYFRA_00001769 [Hymenoscyphus fraxineus]|uniref:Uncharacterized protein n=1 Tax=Hymenoscyphus fraxineus TaxID=746836 RepID=A0A9N9PE42_9HELO|nr:hypothetical protein HYFRA_00001769 [Hymenoscyphus fraxineus]
MEGRPEMEVAKQMADVLIAAMPKMASQGSPLDERPPPGLRVVVKVAAKQGTCILRCLLVDGKDEL